MNISNQCPFQEPLVDVEFAGFWLRFFAIIIDMLILPILLFIFVFLISLGFTIFGETVSSTDSTLEIIGNFLIVIFYWLYFTILESSSWQATIGKNAMGLVVTDEYGNRISFLRANVRYWSKILSSIFMIGFLITAITTKKQGLHDIIANTLVIRVY